MLKSVSIIFSGGGGGGATVTTVVSTASPNPYTATAATGEQVYTIYNTSGSGYTFNLPATPDSNELITLVDAQAITIQGNGNSIIANGTTGTNIQIVSNGGAVRLAWDGIQWTQLS